jgi:hypothetical protein
MRTRSRIAAYSSGRRFSLEWRTPFSEKSVQYQLGGVFDLAVACAGLYLPWLTENSGKDEQAASDCRLHYLLSTSSSVNYLSCRITEAACSLTWNAAPSRYMISNRST